MCRAWSSQWKAEDIPGHRLLFYLTNMRQAHQQSLEREVGIWEENQWEAVILREEPMGSGYPGERSQWEVVVLGRGANEKWSSQEEEPMVNGCPGKSTQREVVILGRRANGKWSSWGRETL